MPASPGDVEKITAKMGRIHPGDTPPAGNPDATPTTNGHTHHSKSNGYLRNEARMPTSSPDLDRSQTRTNDASNVSPASDLSRKPPHTAAKRPLLFNDVPDSTEEACSSFKVIADCLYGSKNMGSTANDALDCDCREDWRDGINYACGEDCINRATRLECLIGASSSCGDFCQNQRFQRKLNASVSVMKTEKKGYGLRANTDLDTNDFVREYVGEVINEPTFRRRMVQYDDEGIKHFYFMSLTKNEFVDATKKGGLGRFCNHSCNPNCYVDKWVIGDKLRMGIFVLRPIQAGEELTFNYNVDRYGADPQPCYCGESNCVGFIGGRTQTERATKLPLMVVEALGIDDGDGWDTMVTKKVRRKRSDEDDEEYVNSLEIKSLTMEGVENVMASLFQSKEKWIIVKVLERIQNTEDEDVLQKVVRLHVYKIMKLLINTWAEDDNVILQVLDILTILPRITKNKITDSGIEAPVRDLTTSENERIAGASKKLIEEWDTLEVGYRIRRRKADATNPRVAAAPGAMRSAVFGADDDAEPSTPASKPVSPLPSNIEIPKGPKSNIPQRNPHAVNRMRRFRPAPPVHARRNFGHDQAEEKPPPGWLMARNPMGVPYYYNAAGAVTWERPTVTADPKPSRSEIEARIIQKIIDDANKAGSSKPTPRSEAAGSSSQTPPESSEAHLPEAGAEKWRSLPVEKQMKIYEHTIFPHVKYVLDKFARKLPKEELKRLAKDLLKKFVASDYKNGRVQDPTAPVSEKLSRNIKSYVKEFLDKAVAKYHGHERPGDPLSEADRATIAQENANAKSRKLANLQGAGGKGAAPAAAATPEADAGPGLANGAPSSSPSAASVKRKHDGAGQEEPLTKRAKESSEPDAELPPPPPPPPPEEITAEERDLLAQEQELMRENEEAQRMEDEEEALRDGTGAQRLTGEAAGVKMEGVSA